MMRARAVMVTPGPVHKEIPMQIDDVKETCKNHSEIIGYGDRLDFLSILKSDTPVALLAIGPLAVIVLVAMDGSICLTEMAVPSDDFDHIVLPDGDLLQKICSAPFTIDIQASGKLESSHGLPLVAAIKDQPTLCGLSRGAKVALGYSPDTNSEDISEAIKSQAHDGSDIFAQLIQAGRDLDDPIFNGKETQSWTADDITELKPVFRDALFVHPSISEGRFILRGSFQDGSACVSDEMDRDLSDPIIDILREILDFDTRFQGECFEYNDGIHSRESGYYPEALIILEMEIDQLPSEHEKFQSWTRLYARMKTSGVPQDVIFDLIGKRKKT